MNALLKFLITSPSMFILNVEKHTDPSLVAFEHPPHMLHKTTRNDFQSTFQKIFFSFLYSLQNAKHQIDELCLVPPLFWAHTFILQQFQSLLSHLFHSVRISSLGNLRWGKSSNSVCSLIHKRIG